MARVSRGAIFLARPLTIAEGSPRGRGSRRCNYLNRSISRARLVRACQPLTGSTLRPDPPGPAHDRGALVPLRASENESPDWLSYD